MVLFVVHDSGIGQREHGAGNYLISWVAGQILKKFFAPAALSSCSCPREEYFDYSLRVFNLN
jgi:hypothetical protein